MECIKVCPLAADLSVIKNCIPCPEEGCGKIFQASSALHLHITKHHRHANLQRRDKSIPTYYYCPEESCVYHVNATRSFTQMKYLKQHYLKVHGERKFACTDCTKAFPTEDALNHHKQICGITFACSCGNNYGSYESLLTHSKRKQHAFDEKFKQYGKRIKTVNRIVPIRKDEISPLVGSPVYILPKLSPDYVGVPVHYLAAVALTELSGACTKIGVDKVVQTEPLETRRKKASSPARASERGAKRRASAQTQTGVITRTRRPRKSAKTQTIGAGTLNSMSRYPEGLPGEGTSCKALKEPGSLKRKKSMETQTSMCNFNNDYLGEDCNFEDAVTPSSKLITGSSSPLYPMAKDVGLPDLWFAHKNSSSTQTSPVSLNQTTISSDLNLTFFECDGNVSAASLRNLNYFEENSDSLDNVVNSTVSQFENTGNNTENLHNLDSLTTVTNYSLLSQQESRLCNIETQTELDSSSVFLSQCSDGSGGQFTMCSNIETQTTEDIFDELLYSNMCTQTCDEGLFSDLDFADIETQTAWPNYGESQDTKLTVNDCKTPVLSSLSIASSLSVSSGNNYKSTKGQTKDKSITASTVKLVIEAKCSNLRPEQLMNKLRNDT